MTLEQEVSLGNGLRIRTCTTTTIPPTQFNQIIQTSSCPETIAASLNEAEWNNSSSQNILHKNAKRAYPYWKVCTVCSTVYPCLTKEQATRNKTCSKECSAEIQRTRPRKRKVHEPNVTCATCGKKFYMPPAWIRRAKRHYCSQSCNGKARAVALVQHNREHPMQVSESERQRRREAMTGSNNPSWRGGISKENAKARKRQVVYVKCPEEYLPMARKDGWIMEHRLVVAQQLKRLLSSTEVVHHVDHNPSNNDPSNLMLFACNTDHRRYEWTGSPEPLWHG